MRIVSTMELIHNLHLDERKLLMFLYDSIKTWMNLQKCNLMNKNMVRKLQINNHQKNCQISYKVTSRYHRWIRLMELLNREMKIQNRANKTRIQVWTIKKELTSMWSYFFLIYFVDTLKLCASMNYTSP